MKLSKLYSTGLAALIALSASSASAPAHNQAKYTNIPFVVAGSCPQYNSADSGNYSAQFVSVNKSLILQVVTNSVAWAGFEIYCSNPGTGTLPGTTTGSYPEGTLTFNFTSTTPVTNWDTFVYYADQPTTTGGANVSVSGNTVSITANSPNITPGANVVNIQIYPETTGTGPSTVTMSNFRYNNTAVLNDTTVTDQSAATGNDFCNGGP